jgi:hypothetical protein
MTSTRKPGAQPGNTNAFKHGFYSRFFKGGEISDLDGVTADLTSEINMMRVVISRALDVFGSDDPVNAEQWIKFMNALSVACGRVASLTRTMQTLAGQDQNGNSVLSQALADALKDWKLPK